MMPIKYGYTALIKACRMKHVHVASFLIEHGAKVNAKSKNGWTPLIEAARVGSVELIRLLLKERPGQARVDVNESNNMGWTPLMEACRNAHFSAIKCLISEGGARVDVRDKVRLRLCNLLWQVTSMIDWGAFGARKI